MLPVPPDSRFRGFRLELDHRAQEIRGQLLFRYVRPDAVPEVPTHVPCADDQARHGTLLRAPHDVRNITFVLRRRFKHSVRRASGHGSRQVRL